MKDCKNVRTSTQLIHIFSHITATSQSTWHTKIQAYTCFMSAQFIRLNPVHEKPRLTWVITWKYPTPYKQRQCRCYSIRFIQLRASFLHPYTIHRLSTTQFTWVQLQDVRCTVLERNWLSSSMQRHMATEHRVATLSVSTRRTFACGTSRKSAFSRCRIPRGQTEDVSVLIRSWSQAAGLDNRSWETGHQRICHRSPSQSQVFSRRDGAVVDIQGILWIDAEVHSKMTCLFVGTSC